MTIKEHTSVAIQTIDLSTQNGNVFALLGLVNRLAPQVDKDFKTISAEMISGDYGNAVFVFNREFGEFFDIILPKNLSMKSIELSHCRATTNSSTMEEVYLK